VLSILTGAGWAADSATGAGALTVFVTVAGFVTGEFNGAPTAISQRWPGWPCGGFIPGAVLTGAATAPGVLVMTGWLVVVAVVAVVAGFAAGEFSGAPTAISQRWPGCPYAGFSPAVATPVVVVAGAVAIAGLLPGTAVFCICNDVSVAGADTAFLVALFARLLSKVALVSTVESELLHAQNILAAIIPVISVFFMIIDLNP